MLSLISLVPSEMYVLLIAVAGLLIVIGAKKFAGTIVLVVLAGIFLPVIAGPIFDAMPAWMLILVIGVMATSLLRQIISLVIGKRATDEMVGILVADLVRLAVVFPFRVIGSVWRLFMK